MKKIELTVEIEVHVDDSIDESSLSIDIDLGAINLRSLKPNENGGLIYKNIVCEAVGIDTVAVRRLE